MGIKDTPASSEVLHLQPVTNRTKCYSEVYWILYRTQDELLTGCKVSQKATVWYHKSYETVIFHVSAAPIRKGYTGSE